MIKKVSVSLPLNKKFLDEILKLSEKLKQNFSLNFNKDLLCRYHINLFSGKLYNIQDLKDKILNLKLFNSSTSLNLFGFGIFLSKNLNIHLRFSSESFLLEIRKFLFFYQDIWENIDATVKENMWVAKSTIFNRNLLIENNSFIEVLKFLENWKFSSKKINFEEICLIDYSNNSEKEIGSYKLLR